MKRFLTGLLLLTIAIPAILAQGLMVGISNYTGTIELGMSIGSFAAIASRGDAEALEALQDQAFLLSGTLSRPIVQEDDPFVAIFEFMEGEWLNPAKVVLHRVLLVFSDAEFSDYLAEASGIRALALVKYPQLVIGPDGALMVLFEALGIRPGL
jgi:hypothetical protein